MTRILSLNPTEKREIEHHLENTRDVMIKAYTIKELAFLDGVDTRRIKTSGKYLPVRVEDKNSRYYQRSGMKRRGYSIRRVRIDEIKYIYNRMNKKTKLVEDYR